MHLDTYIDLPDTCMLHFWNLHYTWKVLGVTLDFLITIRKIRKQQYIIHVGWRGHESLSGSSRISSM